jgi:hypothetical protein
LENTGGNTHALAEIWLKAVKVSSQHQDQRRCGDVSRIVADRLADGRMKRFESAGDLYREVEMFRESVKAYIDASAWGKARQVCDQDAPNLRSMVEQAYQSHMSSAGDASGLVSAGKVSQGLDIFAQKGQWDELFDVCAKSAPEQGPRYATIYATQLIEDGNRVDQAIQVLGRFGADPSEEHLTLYKKIIKGFLGRSHKELQDAKATQSPAVLAESLRSMLYKLVADMKTGASGGGRGGGRSRDFGGAGKYDEGQKSGGSGHLPWFEKALMTTHYVVMRDRFKAWNMTDAATQTAVSLLRFCDVIPPDKAFYLAVRVSLSCFAPCLVGLCFVVVVVLLYLQPIGALTFFPFMTSFFFFFLLFFFLIQIEFLNQTHTTGHGLQRRLAVGEYGVRSAQPLPGHLRGHRGRRPVDH